MAPPSAWGPTRPAGSAVNDFLRSPVSALGFILERFPNHLDVFLGRKAVHDDQIEILGFDIPYDDTLAIDEQGFFNKLSAVDRAPIFPDNDDAHHADSDQRKGISGRAAEVL